MGEHERRGRPPASGISLNGLLPNQAASVSRPLDMDRWSKAEQRTFELVKCIKPNKPSEDLRKAVADYVDRLITNSFPSQFNVQVNTFGSVPLKTYLPDGDIDLTTFSSDERMKETWAHVVRETLESEEKNENAQFRVKEVQYIQAEVKIIKCLVENIVVDISFNQLGGLCTLCFLEEVDNLINQDHLFKRSIILIKAWCYYESRILGAHHGLISTYALETLVLYIFHVFNNSFAGPLEVLYRFLEFFSKFDWDNFCVSLWGPVPISSLPDVAAEPPRKDGGDLLLSKLFLDACSSVYAVYPAGQENQGQPFVSKHFNVIDPLRINNNLGRSVNKGNFFRIRSAFAFGAKKLARLLDCPKEDICYEVNQFFMNTWERHGSGNRPDAPRSGLLLSRLPNLDRCDGSENIKDNSSSKPSVSEALIDVGCGTRAVPPHHVNHPVESTSRTGEVASLSRVQNQRNIANSNNAETYDQTVPNHGMHTEKIQRSMKPDNSAADLGRHLFVRTRSSPELTDDHTEVTSLGKHDRASESEKGQSTSAMSDANWRKNLEPDNFLRQSSRSSTDDHRQTSSRQSHDSAVDSNSYRDGSNLGIMAEEFPSSLGTQGMHQEEQDLVNMMAASANLGFNSQVHVPLNLAPGHIPVPFHPSVLASMGYLQRNMGGGIPTNLPLMESHWGANMQFSQGMVSPQLAHYFSGLDLACSPEDSIDLNNENFSSGDLGIGDGALDMWYEQDRHPATGYELDNRGFEMHQANDKRQPTSTSYSVGRSSISGGSVSSSRNQQRLTRETRASIREERADTRTYQDDKDTDVFVDSRVSRSRPFSSAHSSSVRSTASDSSREGSSLKASKLARERRGRKSSPALPSTLYGKSKSVSEHSSNEVDDDNKDWNASPNSDQLIAESTTAHVVRHQAPDFEPAQMSGSESLIPLILGPGTRQRTTDNSGAVPFAFYPTGPPVPFVTMLPFYNFPTEARRDASAVQFSGEDRLNASDSVQNFVSSDGFDQSETLSNANSVKSASSVEPMEQKADILNSDFTSHWQNLQYGRFCQNPRNPSVPIYQPPVMVPPAYLPGRFPLEGPGRPVSTYMNLVTQPMSHGPRILPVSPLQSVSNRPTGVYKQYVDEMPRYRSGTGTYLPNPKPSVRERHTNIRKGNYAYERSEHNSDRDVNWNNSKPRALGRSHSRNQGERSSLRMDRVAGGENRAERPWNSHKHDSFQAYHSQNGPVHLSSTQSASSNVAYGMYPIPSMSAGGMSSNGPNAPPVVMFYPYDHSAGYASQAEQLEFGSLGPVGFSGEVLHISEGARRAGGFQGERFHGSPAQQSSPDQPSSPHIER